MTRYRVLGWVLSHLFAVVAGMVFLSYLVHPAPRMPPERTTLAPESSISKGVPEGRQTIVVPVKRPTASQKTRIEKKLGAPLPDLPVSSIKDIPKLPEGGTGVIALKTDSAGVTTPQLVIYPKPRKFFEWVNTRELGVYYGEVGGLTGAYNLEVRWDVVRTGPVSWSVKVGGNQLPGAGLESYALVGATVKF